MQIKRGTEIEIVKCDCCRWVSGKTSDGLTFEAKVYDAPSVYGIPTPRFEDGGNVSKLHIRDAVGRDVFLYDRGCCYGETVPHYAEAAGEIVAVLEAEYCKAGE